MNKAMKQTPQRTKVPFRWLRLLTLLSIVLPTTQGLVAQEDDVEGDIFELSPFTIEPNEGWVAENTLAGSRLNTNLRDVAAQIEVMTMDFMDDYALNSIEDAAIYSVNLEAANEWVNATGLLRDAGGNIRIRGLASGTNSKEFFAYSAPSDNYNLDRVTISSGPSSILFGTGSPAGVINSTVKRAQFSDFGTIKGQVDDWNGHRVVLDYNKVLVEDTLAVRFAILNEKKGFQPEPSDQNSTRFYGTLTWKPFENTTIRAMFEHFDIIAKRPSRLFPFDNITPWFESSTLGVDRGGSGGGYPDRFAFPNDANWATPTSEGGLGRTLLLNDLEDQQTFGGYGNNAPQVVHFQPGIPIGTRSNTVEVEQERDWDHVSPLNREADGFTLLDDRYFPTDVNTMYDMNWQEDEGDVINLFIEQKLFENAFFEFAAQKEKTKEFNWLAAGYLDSTQVRVDANTYLNDGVTPNPNVGRLYFEGTSQYDKGKYESEDWRAAISYELDLEEKSDGGWLKWLGRHRLAGLLSGNENWRKYQVYRYSFIPTQNPGAIGQYMWPDFPGVNFALPWQTNADGSWALDDNGQVQRRPGNIRWIGNSGQYRLRWRSYVDESTGWVPQWDHENFPVGQPWAVRDASGHEWQLNPEYTGFYNENGARMVDQARTNAGKLKQDTTQFSYQGFFWEGRIVATYGWRRDEVDGANLANFGRDNFTGLYPHVDDVDFGPWESPDEGDTSTKGIVANPFRGWLNLPIDVGFFYNESDTFQPNTRNFGPFGQNYPGALGDGEDKGITLASQDGRFSLRYNKFENSSGPARAANTPFNRIRWQISPIENRMQAVAPSMPTISGVENRAFPILGNGDPYWVVSFKKASGEEISANWKVTDNFDIRFNWNQQEVTESDIGLEWWDWLGQRTPVWSGVSVPEGGEANPRDLNDDGVIGTWTWDSTNEATGTYPIPWNDNNPNGESVKERFERIVVNGATGVNIIRALDGKANEFVRENRFNLNGMYRFTEGRFKGLSVGGAVRWREAPLLSYGEQVLGGRPSIDLSKPIYGEEQTFVDMTLRYRTKFPALGDRNCTLGLAIRNLLDDDDPIVAMTDVNGNPIRMARVDGRQFIFSVELDL